jgi:hypothetical protein
LYAKDGSYARSANVSEDSSTFTLNSVYEGDYILTSPTSADVDYQEVAQQPGSVLYAPQFTSRPSHFYGSASKPLHVNGDMEGVTIAVPEPTAQEAAMFKQALVQQERQDQVNQPAAPK